MKVFAQLFVTGAVMCFSAGQLGQAAESKANPAKIIAADDSPQLGIIEARWQRTAPRHEAVYRKENIQAYQSADRYYYFKNGILVKVDPGLIEAGEIDRLDERELQSTRAEAEASAKQIADQRYARARELMKRGASAEALGELLWCFDEGMVSTPSLAGVRRSFLLSSIRDLGQNYRPAREALRARHDALVQQALAGDATGEAILDLVALDRAVGVRRAGLGIHETGWERGESVYSESNLERGARGGSSPSAGRTEAFQSEGRYYYFKNGILVKTDPKRIPAKTINQIDHRKIVREYFTHPPLGANEADWRKMSSDPAYLTPVANAFRWRGKYFHFKRGILVRIDSKLIPASDIGRLDEQKLAGNFAARIGLGMAESDWQSHDTEGEIVRQERDLRVYRSRGAYYHFKKSILVAIDPKPIPSLEIAKMDEQKILDENDPALGTAERVVSLRWEPRLISVGGDAIHIYRSAGSYYHFRRGTLAKVAAAPMSLEEVAQLDLRKIFADYLAQAPLGMSHPEWRRPLVYNESGVKAYRTADAFHYFKKGILVKIDPALIPSQAIGQLDEAKFFAANLRTPPQVIALPKRPPAPLPEGPNLPGYDRPQSSFGFLPEFERAAAENMRRD